MRNMQDFDELKFFADVKKRPGVYFGKPSLLSLRDQLFGMEYTLSTAIKLRGFRTANPISTRMTRRIKANCQRQSKCTITRKSLQWFFAREKQEMA